MLHRILSGLILLVFSLACLATAQRPDIIIIDDKELRLNTNPLESYLKGINWKPPEEAAIWSSNWRGYVASWEIKDKHLLLSDITIELNSDSHEDRKRKSILNEIFPAKTEVVAEWYSGVLIVPDGEMTNYIHMGYASTYEAYQILRINNGVVIEHMRMTEQEFRLYKNKKFEKFKESEQFKKEFENLTNGEHDWSEEEAIGFMRSYYAEYYLSN
ncbi:hypothetical protein [Microbulbifer sp. SSSA005]|uniref:hypothetical protein n=1 Tax=Microbulbifer sp. SSSA005 TaxID=3243378 RepID=UPI0040396054